MEQLSAWILAFMLAKAPPGQPQFGGGTESEAETKARYETIANDMAEIVLNEPPFYSGSDGRARTAAVMLSVAFFESAFASKVDAGILRGDAGRSVCLMQLNVGKGRTPPWNKVFGRFALPTDDPSEVEPGWNATELIADRKKCFLVAHRFMRMSINACSRLGPLESLRSYTSGSCSAGSEASRRRMSVAVRWFEAHRPTFTNYDLLLQEVYSF